MSNEYLDRISNAELLELLGKQRVQLKEMHQAYRRDLSLVVLGGDAPSLLNYIRLYVIPETIYSIEKVLEERGVAIPAGQ